MKSPSSRCLQNIKIKMQRIRRILVSEELDFPDPAKTTSYQEKTSFRGLHASPLSCATHKQTQTSTHKDFHKTYILPHMYIDLYTHTQTSTHKHKLLRTYIHTYTLAYGPLASCSHEEALLQTRVVTDNMLFLSV